MSNKKIFFSTFFFMMSLVSISQAGWTFKDGWFKDSDTVATMSAEDHYAIGSEAMACQDWKEAALQFNIVSSSYPTLSYGQDAYYYLGICWMHLNELDFANDAFNQYLKCKNNPEFFLEAIECKFEIAELFKCGAKKRLLGTKQLPKWGSSNKLCLSIYDEIIAAMPCNELAARALFSKGDLLCINKSYRESIDAYQTITKRFPKHPLAPCAYVKINKVYLEQCLNEFQNPDILAFAQINTKRFKQDFPREERIEEAECDVMRIKEVYARGLYETGQFYERTSHNHASIIYYTKAILQFPETHVADLCRQRLMCLGAHIPEHNNTEGENLSSEIGNNSVTELKNSLGS